MALALAYEMSSVDAFVPRAVFLLAQVSQLMDVGFCEIREFTNSSALLGTQETDRGLKERLARYRPGVSDFTT
jgi:hypothetical protein